jgi:hypothetical protein
MVTMLFMRAIILFVPTMEWERGPRGRGGMPGKAPDNFRTSSQQPLTLDIAYGRD